ncbi:MAG: hypothetical protein AB1921_05425 [Thermodesulfobacteriota bacterium]
MSHDLVLASLNLHAVLQNLEELCALDPDSAAQCRDWNVSIQFLVQNGPKARVAFSGGKCTVTPGYPAKSDLLLYFATAGHLNKMFANAAPPIPLKGFSRLYFLATKFSKLTKRLEYFLKPTDELLKSPDYLALNTRMTMNTAVFAAAQIAALDPVGKKVSLGMGKGTVLMKVLPDGPAAHLVVSESGITAHKGDAEEPMARMFMKDLGVANAFLNQKVDAFSAIASSDVSIKGQIPLLDGLSLILDRVPHYLA